MSEAPWMDAKFWGAALLYATYTRWFLERKALDGYSPWFAAFHRIPKLKSIKLCPWGCPVQVGRWRPPGKETERSYDGWFCTVFEASAMLYKQQKNLIYSVSWKLCYPMDSYFAFPAPMVPDGKIGGEQPPKFVDHATFVKPV